MAEQVTLNNDTLVALENMPEGCLDDSPITDGEDRPDRPNSVHTPRPTSTPSAHPSTSVSGPPEVHSNDMVMDTEEEDTLGQDTSKLSNDEQTDQVGESTESATVAEEVYVFKCVFCEMILTSKDTPKILECLHNACGNCVQQKVQDLMDLQQDVAKEIHCTTCGFYMDPNNIIDNQFLTDNANSEDVNKLDDVKCSSCSDEAPASSWCVDCSEFICDNCVQAHQRLKITKDHTIKHKDEGLQEQTSGNNGETPLYCSMHPHERLSLFCENCDKLTCRDCQLTEHRDHKYKFTHEIAADCRKSLNSMLTDIRYKRMLLSSAMKVIDDRQGLINEKKQALVTQITTLVFRLTNTINLRGKQLVSRLNEICDSKHKTLDEKKIALDHLSQITDHCILFTRNVLNFGSDNALLYSKKHLASHLQRIKSRRADIPNPEIPVRIELALDKVSDLIKVVSSIGQIIVDGRVYPSQSQSPGTATPQSSPSPNTGQHPLQQPQQQQQQQQPSQQSQQQQPQPPPPHNNTLYIQQQRMGPYAHPSMQQYAGTSNPQSLLSQYAMKQQQQQQQQNPIQNLSQSVQNLNASKMQGCMQPSAMSALNRLSSLSEQQRQHLQQRMPHQMQQQQQQQHSQQHPHHPQQQQQQPPPQMRQPVPGMPPSMHAHPRMPAPAMSQQVSSSTHPQTNLRNLLQPSGSNPVYIQTGPNQYQAVQPQYVQHYQNRMQPPYRPPQGPPHTQGPQQQQQQQPQQQQSPVNQPPQVGQPPGQRYMLPGQRPPSYNAPPMIRNFAQGGKWHIPQPGNNGLESMAHLHKNVPTATPTLNSNYKIMLKPQNAGSNVTSTNPKTPSPNNYLGNNEGNSTEKSIDKFCEESVNDLMATIAKLDSNGVQVLAENRPKTGGSPLVDSSTGDVVGKLKNETPDKDDPNEDWCAVCMDGGELVCCDKCPKVFHQFCHIPNLTVEESETWQCLLCLNFADIQDIGELPDNDLSHRQRKLAERIILELYCQYELSIPFREIIGPDNTNYHEVIKRPIALDTIRQKLDWNSREHYKALEELVKDVRLMFKNARLYNAIDSQIYNDANALEKFFDEQLEKWLPEYAYEMFEEEEDIPPPNKRYKRILKE